MVAPASPIQLEGQPISPIHYHTTNKTKWRSAVQASQPTQSHFAQTFSLERGAVQISQLTVHHIQYTLLFRANPHHPLRTPHLYLPILPGIYSTPVEQLLRALIPSEKNLIR